MSTIRKQNVQTIYSFGGFKLNKKFLNVVKIFAVLSIIIYLSFLVKVISFQSDAPKKADVIIVLGHSITDDLKPSDWLDIRLSDALWLYENDFADKIIVSGGKGPTDRIAVSRVMADWLIENDIDEENIFVEDKASNTFENLIYSKKIAKENDMKEVIVVTNDFHLYRSGLITEKFFDNRILFGRSVDMSFKKIFAYVKEPLSILKFEIENFFYGGEY